MPDEIVSEFLVESYESLDQLDRDLLALEDTPEDRDRMASVFRTIHTIKGTSGFLALPKLERVTHVGESLLVPLRDGELTLTNEIASNLLAMVDAVRSILGSIEQGTGEGDNEYAELIANLERLKIGDTGSESQTDSNRQEVEAEPAPCHDGEDGEDPSEESVAADKAPAKKKAPSKKKTSAKKESTGEEEGDSKAIRSDREVINQSFRGVSQKGRSFR